MSFYEVYLQFKDFDFEGFFASVDDKDIEQVLGRDDLDPLDFLTLLAPQAAKHLEAMAQKAHRLTIQHFGKVILLYTPMYLSSYCSNQCIYCSFNAGNHLPRKKLTLDEVVEEARAIAATGLRHILILTGESRRMSPVSYLADCTRVLLEYFSSVSIEVYPLETKEYETLIAAGVDGLTIYQEVYDRKTYDRLHLSGPKKDYRYRLDAPERGCRAGMREVNIGALLGLEPNWRREAFFTGMHAHYLQNKYLETEIAVSLPRLRPVREDSTSYTLLSDLDVVQNLLALRLFLPRCGITISTRERASLRDNLIGLGVTKMSAGTTTEVGGHSQGEHGHGQFEIFDRRGVPEIKAAITRKGYQPVFKNWHPLPRSAG